MADSPASARPAMVCHVFGFGPMEMALVALLIVLLFPPHELPAIARSVARAYGSFRRTTDELRRAVMLDDELRKPLDEIRNAYDEARFDLRQAHESLRIDMHVGKRAINEVKGEVRKTAALITEPEAAKGPTSLGTAPKIQPAVGTLARGSDPAISADKEAASSESAPESKTSAPNVDDSLRGETTSS